MKVAIWVDAAESLKAGGKHAGAYALDVDGGALTVEERDILARKCASCSNSDRWRGVAADLYLIYGPGPTSLHAATLDDLRRVLASALAEVAEDARKAAERARAEAERNAETDARLSVAPVRELVCGGDYGGSFAPVYETGRPDSHPLTAARRAEAEAEAARLNAERAAAKEAAKEAEAERAAEKAAALEAAKAKLAEWAAAHGSELVRERMAAGYSCWVGGAIDELAESVARTVAGDLTAAGEAPEGTETDTEERKCPTLAELRALKAVRERAGAVGDGCAVSVALLLVTYTPEDDGDSEEYKQTELEVRVYVFGQWERNYYYLTGAE